VWQVWAETGPKLLENPGDTRWHHIEKDVDKKNCCLDSGGKRLMHTDEHLLQVLRKYDQWMREGKIPYAGKVLPIREAFHMGQWILPTQQAIEILRNARSFALADCTCRSHYRRCNHPLDTCLLINDMADAFVEAGNARRLSLTEAEVILRKANVHGLVHQTAYNPEQSFWAVCSCCSCCCYRLQMLKLFGRNDLVVHSDYIALTEDNRCTDCGLCIPRCIFDAREMVAGKMIYHAERCYGCGLCVTACPEEAIVLELRTSLAQRRGAEHAA
jgi:ferredoxin